MYINKKSINKKIKINNWQLIKIDIFEDNDVTRIKKEKIIHLIYE